MNRNNFNAEQIPILYKNYETRVKDFITYMTLPDHKIVLKDSTVKVKNPRAQLMNESVYPKPFIFKGYKTDADRIKDSVRNNRYLYNLPDYDEILSKKRTKIIDDGLPKINRFPNKTSIESEKPSPESTNKQLTNSEKNKKDFDNIVSFRKLSIIDKKKLKYLAKNKLILQPTMKFRARTDLERVYDAINGNYFKEDEKEILNRQLQHLDLFSFKKPGRLLSNKKNIDDTFQGLITETYVSPKEYKVKKNPLLEMQKENEKKKGSMALGKFILTEKKTIKSLGLGKQI